MDAAELAHLPQVVALQVGDHEQLGILFDRGLQLLHRLLIALRVLRKPGPRALNRAGLNAAPAQMEKALGRGGENALVIQLQVGGIGRGGDSPQALVEPQGICLVRPRGLPWVGEVHLIDVPSGNVILRALDGGHEVRPRHLRPKIELRSWTRRHVLQRRGKAAALGPGLRCVIVAKHMRVVAKDELAVKPDPAEQATRPPLPLLQGGLDPGPVLGHVPAQLRLGRGGDQRARPRAGAGGVQKDQSPQILKPSRHPQGTARDAHSPPEPRIFGPESLDFATFGLWH